MADKITNCGVFKRKTGSSFQALVGGFIGQALSNLDRDIASKNTGIIDIATDGPVFTVCLGKVNDVYYSGFLFGYSLSYNFFYFVRLNGNYFLTECGGGGYLKPLFLNALRHLKGGVRHERQNSNDCAEETYGKLRFGSASCGSHIRPNGRRIRRNGNVQQEQLLFLLGLSFMEWIRANIYKLLRISNSEMDDSRRYVDGDDHQRISVITKAGCPA